MIDDRGGGIRIRGTSPPLSDLISTELIVAVKEQLRINWRGIHGISHWARVYENGLLLAAHTGADTRVVELFALFHDSRRLNEGPDPEHGPRGAQLAAQLREHYFQIPDDAFRLLVTACRLHTSETTHTDPTVQTCFDADRLDLGRIGKTPDPRLLSTRAAKDPEIIAWAVRQSVTGVVPDNILGNAMQWFD
jgi:uncharacterized protein